MAFTNSSLKTARRCLREFDLRYRQGFALLEEEAEALIVGTAWHNLHEFAHEAASGAPWWTRDVHGYLETLDLEPLWRERLGRLWGAYCAKYQDDGLEVLEVEATFDTEIDGLAFQGQIDAIVRDGYGRVGILERKTTAMDVSPASTYWDRLEVDTQIGIYAMAVESIIGKPADMVIYDVVVKPRSRPKTVTRKAAEELEDGPSYCGHLVSDASREYVLEALAAGEKVIEPLDLYGARLTAELVENPVKYFARRELVRSKQQRQNLLETLHDQARLISSCEELDAWPRNPDACFSFGRACDFIALCNRGEHPRRDDGVPEGFRLKTTIHEELI